MIRITYNNLTREFAIVGDKISSPLNAKDPNVDYVVVYKLGDNTSLMTQQRTDNKPPKIKIRQLKVKAKTSAEALSKFKLQISKKLVNGVAMSPQMPKAFKLPDEQKDSDDYKTRLSQSK